MLNIDLSLYAKTETDQFILPTQAELTRSVREESLFHARDFFQDYEIQKIVPLNAEELQIFCLGFAIALVRVRSSYTSLDLKTKILRYVPPFRQFIKKGIEHFTQIRNMEVTAAAEMYEELESLRPLSPQSFVKVAWFGDVLGTQWMKTKTQNDVPQLIQFIDQRIKEYRSMS